MSMDERTQRALDCLRANGYTCVFQGDGEVLTSRARGVAPLMELLRDRRDLRGFCAADKVVGRAAAFLYVLLEVEELYAEVISASAREVLVQYGVPFFAGTTVEAIRNRTGDGFCPMETATREATTPEQALKMIQKALQELSKKAKDQA